MVVENSLEAFQNPEEVLGLVVSELAMDVVLEGPTQNWFWTFTRKKLVFNGPFGSVFWQLPRDFRREHLHPDLLYVATEVLLSPWVKGILDGWVPTRKHGNFPGLSLSGGIDSTACMEIMPAETVLVYHRRSFKSLLKHHGADRLFKYLRRKRGRRVHSITSDHEKIRTFWEKPTGFSTDMAAAIHLILFADYFDLRGIALGMPIDNTYLWHGYRYREFSETSWWRTWAPLMESIGLDLLLPIAGISEASAVHIVQQAGLGNIVSSCLRAKHPGCGRCWKCFHKNGMLGHPYDIEAREIQAFLGKRPVRTATHALWWVGEQNHWDQVPDLHHLKEKDFSWWVKHHPPAFDLLPDWIRPSIQSAIEDATEPIPEDSEFYTWNLFPDTE